MRGWWPKSSWSTFLPAITLLTILSVIAVHGLNPRGKADSDHAWDTWRTPAGDDLPRDLPESRTFLYQYNSTVVFGRDRSTFIDKANNLLEEIRIERFGIESRPILLLGHSMGGILIKQALVNAHNNPRYSSIKLATQGVVFFATPHRGADGLLLTLGDGLSTIASYLGFQRGENILEVLKSQSIITETMQEQWKHQLEQYHIVSFWGTFDDIVSRQSARLDLPGNRESLVQLNADHSGVCKFGSSPNRPG
ncbi:uncharacterized protein F4822DRAFT_354383 [Hypoxylon trugodes]|uniref:uncharacterized protein n=1 Tax=Hypoxylon trugodes TaxID=326681 RepID=UPI0021970047|nr:uncharacterized protein F4822DRAFT_354383 [Hypoxylon trugodes]KAI1385773.1 hypothetical protein F4822DRAFT_354383 [Hypoxylon trugodes]